MGKGISLSQEIEQVPVSEYILVTLQIPGGEIQMAWQHYAHRYTPASMPQ